MTAKYRLLIVDDEPDIRAEITEYFAYKGYHVTSAGNGDEALEKFRAEPFDAVITDIKMSHGSGTELARNLRAIGPDLPIIFITGHSSGEEFDKDHELGAIITLRKPVKLRDLDALVAKLLKPTGKAKPAMASPPLRNHGSS